MPRGSSPSACYLSKRKVLSMSHRTVSPKRMAAMEEFDRLKALREELPNEPIFDPDLITTETTYPNSQTNPLSPVERASSPMPHTSPGNGNSAEIVGQVGNLRRVVNPPGTACKQAKGAGCQPARRIPSCPTTNADCAVLGKVCGIGLQPAMPASLQAFSNSCDGSPKPLERAPGVQGQATKPRNSRQFPEQRSHERSVPEFGG
jgi:hypothetical protein